MLRTASTSERCADTRSPCTSTSSARVRHGRRLHVTIIADVSFPVVRRKRGVTRHQLHVGAQHLNCRNRSQSPQNCRGAAAERRVRHNKNLFNSCLLYMIFTLRFPFFNCRDLLESGSILTCLYPGDDGSKSPNSANTYVLQSAGCVSVVFTLNLCDVAAFLLSVVFQHLQSASVHVSRRNPLPLAAAHLWPSVPRQRTCCVVQLR